MDRCTPWRDQHCPELSGAWRAAGRVLRLETSARADRPRCTAGIGPEKSGEGTSVLWRARAAGDCGACASRELWQMLSSMQRKRPVTAQKASEQPDKIRSSRSTERRSGAAGLYRQEARRQIFKRYDTDQMCGRQAVSGRCVGLL